MFRSRGATSASNDNNVDKTSEPLFITPENTSPSSDVGSTDIKTLGVEDSQAVEAQKDFAVVEFSKEAERFELFRRSVSPISSQIPQLGWCCDHFGCITSFVSCAGAFIGAAAMFKFLDDTHTAIILIAGFLLFLGCIMFVWGIREVVRLYAKKKFVKEQRRREAAYDASQPSTSRPMVQLSQAASQASASRHVEETVLGTSSSLSSDEKPPSGSQPSKSRRLKETESSASTPTEPASEFPSTPEEGTDKPPSPRGKYPPKGDYRKGKRTGSYTETDL